MFTASFDLSFAVTLKILHITDPSSYLNSNIVKLIKLEGMMGGACSTYGGADKCVQNCWKV
jgi:hypothetical protein